MLVPVILAGGLGSRLWPLSRQAYPKQFIPLLNGKSLFVQSLDRVAQLPDCHTPIVLGNEQHRFILSEQVKQANWQDVSIILEPCFKGTAAAVALAAMQALAKYDEDVLLLVLSSDHVIADQEGFNESVQQACSAAQQGKLVTFGIKPTRPETAYGYIQVGKSLSTENSFKISSFVEKPNSVKAQQYLNEGNYLWNSGMFLFSASTFLQELLLHDTNMYQAVKSAFRLSTQDGQFIRPHQVEFNEIIPDSIDYAVMEKTSNGAVVPLKSSWSDVGSWDALMDLYEKDEVGNVCIGDVLAENTRSCYIQSDSRLVVAVGVSNLVIVETPDSVLVLDRAQAQNIKTVVSKLSTSKRKEVTYHRRVSRPWGAFESIDDGERFQVKHITVSVGGCLSLQRHHHRSEHWVVVKGTARVIRGEENFLLTENQSTYIPIGTNHRLENVGKIPLEIIEVQSGAYLGEDDIVRLDDHYGRTKEINYPV